MKATKYQKKSQIKLEDLLRRRKSNLQQFLKDRGITTYEGLDSMCKRLGVTSPSHEFFSLCIDNYVSNPSAGVIVVPPPILIEESTGNPVNSFEEDKFEELRPQISVKEHIENGTSEISVVLQDAMTPTKKLHLSKKQLKNLKKEENSFNMTEVKDS